MSRAIKVEDQVYQELDTLRGKGETFSKVVARLLEARLKFFETLNFIEGVLKYQEWKQQELLKIIKEEQAKGSSVKEGVHDTR